MPPHHTHSTCNVPVLQLHSPLPQPQSCRHGPCLPLHCCQVVGHLVPQSQESRVEGGLDLHLLCCVAWGGDGMG